MTMLCLPASHALANDEGARNWKKQAAKIIADITALCLAEGSGSSLHVLRARSLKGDGSSVLVSSLQPCTKRTPKNTQQDRISC